MSAMDREYWTKQLREAEAALEAAKKKSDVDAAAKRLRRAKAELRALEEEPPTPPRANRRSAPVGVIGSRDQESAAGAWNNNGRFGVILQIIYLAPNAARLMKRASAALVTFVGARSLIERGGWSCS
jgi:hypothetical protein